MGKTGGIAASGKMAGGRLLNIRQIISEGAIAATVNLAAAVLFYDSVYGMVLFPLIYLLVNRYMTHKRNCKRLAQINLEFKDYMYAVSSVLMAGYSIEKAFLKGLEEMKMLYGADCALLIQLGQMERRIGLQEPIEQILKDFAEESKSEDINSFVEIFCYAKRGGGDFIHIIRTTIERICDKIEVSEEIHTVMSEKALEQKIMCVIPLGILGFLRLTSPEFIGVLYGNAMGIFIMTIALFVYGCSFFLGEKIVEVEV